LWHGRPHQKALSERKSKVSKIIGQTDRYAALRKSFEKEEMQIQFRIWIRQFNRLPWRKK